MTSLSTGKAPLRDQCWKTAGYGSKAAAVSDAAAVLDFPRVIKYPATESRASAPAQVMNKWRTPSFCARNPESINPSTWEKETRDIKLLLTRPTMSRGVSCWDMVWAGTQTKEIPNPMLKVLRA